MFSREWKIFPPSLLNWNEERIIAQALMDAKRETVEKFSAILYDSSRFNARENFSVPRSQNLACLFGIFIRYMFFKIWKSDQIGWLSVSKIDNNFYSDLWTHLDSREIDR